MASTTKWQQDDWPQRIQIKQKAEQDAQPQGWASSPLSPLWPYPLLFSFVVFLRFLRVQFIR
jgi:hypothetical protein